MYNINIFYILFLIFLDQITKYLSWKFIMPVEEIKIINNFFNLTYVENKGIAFGIFQGGRWVFIIFTIIIFFIIFKNYKKLNIIRENKFINFSFILILSGSIGNFIDRLFLGYVKDFLNFYFLKIPVFNFADFYIITGVLIYIYYTFFIFKKESKKK